jgi:hypothetical protein
MQKSEQHKQYSRKIEADTIHTVLSETDHQFSRKSSARSGYHCITKNSDLTTKAIMLMFGHHTQQLLLFSIYRIKIFEPCLYVDQTNSAPCIAATKHNRNDTLSIQGIHQSDTIFNLNTYAVGLDSNFRHKNISLNIVYKNKSAAPKKHYSRHLKQTLQAPPQHPCSYPITFALEIIAIFSVDHKFSHQLGRQHSPLP